MCNTSECIAETLCIEDQINPDQDPMMRKLVMNTEANSNELNDEKCTRKNSSFKQVCEFPISVYRRGSKDLLAWINGLTTAKRSPLEIVQELYSQIQPSLFLVLMCLAVVAIIIEACICLVLLINVLLEPGFLFLFITFVGVGYVGLRLQTNKQKAKSKSKVKSKEI